VKLEDMSLSMLLERAARMLEKPSFFEGDKIAALEAILEAWGRVK